MEAAGFTIGVVALASLFSTCLECFEIVELGCHYSRDLEILIVKLESQRLILSIWGNAIGLDNHGQGFNDQLLGPDTQRTIFRLLSCIRMLFEDSEKLRRFYGLHKLKKSRKSRKQNRKSAAVADTVINPWDRFRKGLSLRQKQTDLSVKIRWAIHDKAKFSNLLGDLKDLIEQLRDMTASVADLEKQKKRFIDEISSVSDFHSLEILEEALKDDIPELSEVASQRIAQLTSGSMVETMDLDAVTQSVYLPAPSIIGYQVSSVNEEILEAYSSENGSSFGLTASLTSTSDLSASHQSDIVYGHQNNLGDIQIRDKRKTREAIQKWEQSDETGRSILYRRVIMQLRMVDEPFVSIAPIEDNLMSLLGSIQGPPGTPYEGGVFFLRMDIPAEYPFEHPHCYFLTPVFHPNVDKHGNIFVNFLSYSDGEKGWSPIWTIGKILVAICSLLNDPNWLTPAFFEMREVYGEDPVGFEMQARIFTQRHARGTLPTLKSYSEAFKDTFPMLDDFNDEAIENQNIMELIAAAEKHDAQHRRQKQRFFNSTWFGWVVWIIFLAIFYGPTIFYIYLFMSKPSLLTGINVVLKV